jgi:hypothetical protein
MAIYYTYDLWLTYYTTLILVQFRGNKPKPMYRRQAYCGLYWYYSKNLRPKERIYE